MELLLQIKQAFLRLEQIKVSGTEKQRVANLACCTHVFTFQSNVEQTEKKVEK